MRPTRNAAVDVSRDAIRDAAVGPAGAVSREATTDPSPGSPGRGGAMGGTERLGPARLVVLISGTGSNLAALLRACQDPGYGAQVVGVVADRPCAGLAHAEAAGVPTAVVLPRDYPERAVWDEALARAVAVHEPDLVVCAGFMRLLGTGFLNRFPGRIINTHPSLLPDFPGAHAVRDALAAGARRAGATVFWVDEGVDTGAIIAQVEVEVLESDDEDALTERIKAAETPQLIDVVARLARRSRTEGSGKGA
ncbi:phosphoribosylglycinamide formyltransferase [Actinomyces bowdenii]|nr:phosphoribosylglycinamide formyltransferase [Actinomyces bowdenii]